jgi:hypothetical protein
MRRVCRRVAELHWERRSLFDVALLGHWLRDNPQFYSRTRSRVVSYWNCYYRTTRFETYVGSQLIAFFDDAIALHPHEPGALGISREG